MSKRQEFLKRKNLSSNLKKYNAFSTYGYYPLFSDIETAKIVSPLTSYHIHEFEGVEYYMPNGLEMGKTQFHGDYDGPEIIQPEEQVTQPEQQIITPPPVVIPEPEPEPDTEPTYIPPPPTRSRGGGGGSGGY